MGKILKRIIILLTILILVGCSSRSLAPGVYEGSGSGWNPDVPILISVTVDGDGKVSDITVLSNQETPEIGEKALKELITNAKDNGEIDTISKATETSKGFKEAMEDALRKAEK